jgi:magnesium chelatase family protein
MDYAVVLSRAGHGLDAPLVRVEVHISGGLPALTIVGMPETSVRESRDRVRSALLKSHFAFPDGRITVNLAPADIPKGGGRFDLPVALGILCASGQLPGEALRDIECLGELALDGGLRDVRGLVASALAATRAGRRLAIPTCAAARCRNVPSVRLVSAPDLLSLCARLRAQEEDDDAGAPDQGCAPRGPDLCDVEGLPQGRRALEICAAGGHNLLFHGPPGTGKSLLASCLPGILPPPEPQEVLTMRALKDLQSAEPFGVTRPFRAPHHSASAAALVGGGSVPRPGEISLAHGGVLFLDELPEFPRHILDMLRQPMETGEIRLSRARHQICYPARFQLVAAMNPCPCGFSGDPDHPCRCSEGQKRAYANRVSGPLLDRIDLQVALVRQPTRDLFARRENEGSAAVRERVMAARALQARRQGGSNATVEGRELISVCNLGAGEQALMEKAAETLGLSARAVLRCLRVARTISDLNGAERVGSGPLKEALALRQSVGLPP